VLKKIGAEFVLYEFRHTFATRFGEKVGDPIALAAILGHANLKMVMRYCHPQDSHTAKAMQAYIHSLDSESGFSTTNCVMTTEQPIRVQ
jgi:integrase